MREEAGVRGSWKRFGAARTNSSDAIGKQINFIGFVGGEIMFGLSKVLRSYFTGYVCGFFLV